MIAVSPREAYVALAALLALCVYALHCRAEAQRARGLYVELLLSTQVAPGQVWAAGRFLNLHVIRVDGAGVTFSYRHPLAPEYQGARDGVHDPWPAWRDRLRRGDLLLTRRDWGREEPEELGFPPGRPT